MAKSAKSSPKSKARRPDVYPLGEHLAALLNPALVEKPQGFAEAPQAPFAAESDTRPRGVTGAPATIESLKTLLELGDPNLREAFEAIRRRTLRTAVHRDTLRADVREMRIRMRRELSKAGAGQFDIKQDAGGIADIEFLVQYWVLAAADAHPELLTHTDNIRQLEGLAQVGVLERITAQWLTDTYIGYRTVLHHMSLEGQGDRVVEAGPYADTRARVTAIWRETFE